MKKSDKIWNEKYRPKNIDDIVQQDNIKQIIKNSCSNGTMPHMLLYGDSGTGKTTTALAICRMLFYDPLKNKLYNDKLFRERILFLNASDERGIQFVREDIKTFAESEIMMHPNIPNFKVVILDESDAMTSDSQFALRMIMEKYSYTTRFILICNYVARIIAPLRSRTMNIRYKNINIDTMKNVVEHICEKEHIKVDDQFIEELRNICKGDLRKGINLLEHVSYLDIKLNNEHNILSLKTLYECSGVINKELMNKIINTLFNTTIKSYVNILNLSNEFLNEAYSIDELIEELFNYIIQSNFDDKRKAKYMLILSDVDASINDNASEQMCITYIFSELYYLD